MIFLLLFCCTCFIKMKLGYYLVFTYAPIFCLGVSLVDVFTNRRLSSFVLPILFSCVIVYRFDMGTLLILAISCLVILYVDRFNKILFILGEISYSLYLTHTLVLIVLTGIFHKLKFNLEGYHLLWLFVEVVTALLFSKLFYQIIEKPSLKWSKRIFYSRK